MIVPAEAVLEGMEYSTELDDSGVARVNNHLLSVFGEHPSLDREDFHDYVEDGMRLVHWCPTNSRRIFVGGAHCGCLLVRDEFIGQVVKVPDEVDEEHLTSYVVTGEWSTTARAWVMRAVPES